MKLLSSPMIPYGLDGNPVIGEADRIAVGEGINDVHGLPHALDGRLTVLNTEDVSLKLSSEARAALAASLLESLEEGVDENVEAAWAAEIAKRIREVDSGAVAPVPWSKARRRILGQ